MKINEAVKLIREDGFDFQIDGRLFHTDYNCGTYIRETNVGDYYEFFLDEGFDEEWIDKNGISYIDNDCSTDNAPEFDDSNFDIYLSIIFKELLEDRHKIGVDGQFVNKGKLKHCDI
jgi:hypothetical protein